MNPRACACALLVLLLVLGMGLPASAAEDASDAAALEELQQLLSDPAARDANARSDPRAAQAEGMFQGFPPYARKELDAIVLTIMKESGEGATRHTDAYASGGAKAASESFSPAVRARIAALEERLANDPDWNTPENLERMQTLFPAFLGRN